MAEIYVDPTNGSDSTGDGSKAAPYASVQGAIDNYGLFETAGPNYIWLANTSADVLSSSIDASAVASMEAPLWICGGADPSAAAGEWGYGGSMTIETANGTVAGGYLDGNDAIANIAAPAYVNFYRMKLANVTGLVMMTTNIISFVGCEITNFYTTVNYYFLANIIACYIHDENGHHMAYGAVGMAQGARVEDCIVSVGSMGISAINSCRGNLVTDVDLYGIVIRGDATEVSKNTIDASATPNSGAVGIVNLTATAEQALIFDNLVTNFDGTSNYAWKDIASGTFSLLANNNYYNCTAKENLTYSYSDFEGEYPNNLESSDPFVNRAAGDYSIAAGAISKGSAAFLLGGDPDNPDDVGAVQDHSAGTSSGLIMPAVYSF